MVNICLQMLTSALPPLPGVDHWFTINPDLFARALGQSTKMINDWDLQKLREEHGKG
ncbi:MAG: hypothetical protein K6G22_05010 [Lachnospiraceae bacterium]|nr:hypothetical protein [Lachnospiraceae bacterium]